MNIPRSWASEPNPAALLCRARNARGDTCRAVEQPMLKAVQAPRANERLFRATNYSVNLLKSRSSV
jgi:hypothetical protein